jgi:hypothetical protein
MRGIYVEVWKTHLQMRGIAFRPGERVSALGTEAPSGIYIYPLTKIVMRPALD